MSTIKRLVLAGSVAMLMLSLLAGASAALRSLSVSQTLITLLFTLLTFLGPLEVVCDVGLTITSGVAIPKTPNAIIGRVTPRILRCATGTATILGAPWNVKYVSIAGTLPEITSFTLEIERAQFLVRNILACLVISESLGPQRVSRGTVGNLEARPFGLQNVRIVSGPCEEAEVQFIGTAVPTNGPITIRLI